MRRRLATTADGNNAAEPADAGPMVASCPKPCFFSPTLNLDHSALVIYLASVSFYLNPPTASAAQRWRAPVRGGQLRWRRACVMCPCVAGSRAGVNHAAPCMHAGDCSGMRCPPARLARARHRCVGCGRRQSMTGRSGDRAIGRSPHGDTQKARGRRAPAGANPGAPPSAARCGCCWGGATGPCR